MSEKRDKAVNIRVTESEKDRLDGLAKRHRCEGMRELLWLAIDRLEASEAEAEAVTQSSDAVASALFDSERRTAARLEALAKEVHALAIVTLAHTPEPQGEEDRRRLAAKAERRAGALWKKAAGIGLAALLCVAPSVTRADVADFFWSLPASERGMDYWQGMLGFGWKPEPLEVIEVATFEAMTGLPSSLPPACAGPVERTTKGGMADAARAGCGTEVVVPNGVLSGRLTQRCSADKPLIVRSERPGGSGIGNLELAGSGIVLQGFRVDGDIRVTGAGNAIGRNQFLNGGGVTVYGDNNRIHHNNAHAGPARRVVFDLNDRARGTVVDHNLATGGIEGKNIAGKDQATIVVYAGQQARDPKRTGTVIADNLFALTTNASRIRAVHVKSSGNLVEGNRVEGRATISDRAGSGNVYAGNVGGKFVDRQGDARVSSGKAVTRAKVGMSAPDPAC